MLNGCFSLCPQCNIGARQIRGRDKAAQEAVWTACDVELFTLGGCVYRNGALDPAIRQDESQPWRLP